MLPGSLAQEQPLRSSTVSFKKMDEAAAHFQTAEANFVFNQYQKVVDETDTQTGTVYYRNRDKTSR